MSTTLHLLHDQHFDLLGFEDAPEGGESLGSYTVLGRDGEEVRGKYRFDAPGGDTVVELPDDYDINDLQSVTHLVQTLQDRHSDRVTGVECDDEAVGRKIAAFLGCDYVTTAAPATPAMESPSEIPAMESAP